MIVIDASALVAALVQKSAAAGALRDRLRGQALSAPSLIDAEVLHVLRGLACGGKVPQATATGAVSLLAAMPLRRAPLRPFLGRAWQLRGNLSAYDAFYVALAESLGCVLITCDARLSRASGPACPIEVFAPN